ncbi:hypothetical protein BS049_RS20275 [Vibrio parahaemolyticus]|nr:hypothetical protein [Vibrio parahaemolyticus]
MKTYLIYKKNNAENTTKITYRFTCQPSAKLKKLCGKFKILIEHLSHWQAFSAETSIKHSTNIDFFATFKEKELKTISTQYLKQALEVLSQPTIARHYRLPIFDHVKKIDDWFDEVGILIEGPYRLHYDYAKQYRTIQKCHASTPSTSIYSLEELYNLQQQHFPINIEHLVLCLPDFSRKREAQLSYLKLIHYLSLHSNKFSGQCYKTIPQIQSALCISQPTLHRMLTTLERNNWITTKYKAPKTTTKVLTLTPIFWACISGRPINANLVKTNIKPMMDAVLECWGTNAVEYQEMTSYPFFRHIAQIQHVTKFYQAAIKNSNLGTIRNEALKQLTLMKYG